MRDLFAWNFQKKVKPDTKEAGKIIKNLPKIDKIITASAPSWPLEKINRIDLAILRLAIFELIIVKEAPYKVIIDEAVELGKEFGADSSPEFINGVLGKVVKEKGIEKNE